jgi:hypothetical protein
MNRASDIAGIVERGEPATSITPAKAEALAALHVKRRGVRQRPASRARETVLGDVHRLLAEPVRGEVSIRALATHCGVSDRTLRRWLSGEDWPPATQVTRLAAWVRKRSR